MRISSLLPWLAVGFLVACSDHGTSTGTSTIGQGGGPSTTGTATSAATSVTSSGATTGAGGMGAFSLTSNGFTEGAAIPAKYACPSDLSPDLHWPGGPGGALSYAVVLTDKSNSLLHWAIWDIPSTPTSLPEGIQQLANPAMPPGAKQVKSFDNTTFGYRGPCPPSKHTYQFVVYALDVALLPNVTTASSLAEVETAVKSHSLASASLTGTYTP